MTDISLFADIILPLAVPKPYTYAIPSEWQQEAKVGQSVVVQFGRQKFYTGIIYKLHSTRPGEFNPKPIEEISVGTPLVTMEQLKFWAWMSDYYCCTLGEVMNAAIPSSLKISSETRIMLHASWSKQAYDGKAKEGTLIQALLNREEMSVAEVAELFGIKTVQPLINDLLKRKILVVSEEVKTHYKPKVEEFVRLASGFVEEKQLQEAFELVKRAPRQEEVLLTYIQLSQRYQEAPREVKRIVLQRKAQATSALVNQLVQKGILEIYTREVGRLPQGLGDGNNSLYLTDLQEKKLQQLKESWSQNSTALLFGVTSSGKTEIYIQLIRETIEKGGQVLYLLPEIALTTQMVERLQQHFGDAVGIYHSKFSQQEKAELWLTMRQPDGRFKIVLGARSSLLLPFNNLQLIIVDEEHETTFKQFDPAPRYHARDSGIMLAQIAGAKVLLGSATPSVESFWLAAGEHKYGFAELKERFGGSLLPDIEIADKSIAKLGKRAADMFTPDLETAIKETLEKKEQVILFQNRRGYSPMWLCQKCGWVPHCDQCDVSTTYHKWRHQLMCHYCGKYYTPPTRCPACGSHELKMVGFGTERIEEELAVRIPEARVARLDLDSARSKYAFQKIIDDFRDGGIDILVGTQMVTKGLDFENVTLVGVMDADGLIQFPDFRAHERAFQLMEQVSGRSGRRDKKGKVIIQTRNPNHPILQYVLNHDYRGFFQSEISERKQFAYPPFTRLIRITLRHRDRDLVEQLSAELVSTLVQIFGKPRVLGPEYPLVPRIKRLYLKQVLLKVERGRSFSKVKLLLLTSITDFLQMYHLNNHAVIIDVDPR